MKRILLILTCLCFILFSGCKKENEPIKPITTNISFVAEISHNGICNKYNVKIDKNSNTELEAIDNGLNGLSLYFSGDEITEKFNKLEHKFKVSSLPQGVITDFIHSVFLTATKDNHDIETENEQYIIKGENNRYSFKIYLGQSGLPIKIEDKKNDIKVIIKNASIYS